MLPLVCFVCLLTGRYVAQLCCLQDNTEKQAQIERLLREKRAVESELQKVELSICVCVCVCGGRGVCVCVCVRESVKEVVCTCMYV